MSRISEIGGWLKGSGMLAQVSQPGGHYLTRIANQIEFVKVLLEPSPPHLHRGFPLPPFWCLHGVSSITLTNSGSAITPPCNVFSEPVITVYGSGDISLKVGLTIAELNPSLLQCGKYDRKMVHKDRGGGILVVGLLMSNE